MELKLTPELIEKLNAAESPEALRALAAENNVPLSEGAANRYFASLHESGELSDDELANVSGGGCGSKKKEYCTRCGEEMDTCLVGSTFDDTLEVVTYCPRCDSAAPTFF